MYQPDFQPSPKTNARDPEAWLPHHWRVAVNVLLAWLLYAVALAWSLLVGLLAGVGAVVVARRSTDALNVLVAVLFMFGGALVLAARMIAANYLLLGMVGFGGGILLALALHSGVPIPLFKEESEGLFNGSLHGARNPDGAREHGPESGR